MTEKETVTLEKKLYDDLRKRNADLIDENEELEEKNRCLQKELNESIDQNRKNVYDVLVQAARGEDYALKVVKNLEAEKEKLMEVLKFYAADENYHMHETYGNTNVRNDNGQRAREALKEIEK